MSAENIYAYTAPGGSFPEFVSINRESGSGVTISVRSPQQLGGETGFIALTEDQWHELLRAGNADAARRNKVIKDQLVG